MTYRYMLDATTTSALIDDASGKLEGRILRTGLDRVCTSIIVAAEHYYGAAKRRSTPLAVRVDRALTMIAVLPWAHPAERIYGDLRVDLERRGRTMGRHDMLIAAHALALDCTLVTDDDGFRHVDGLRRESWL